MTKKPAKKAPKKNGRPRLLSAKQNANICARYLAGETQDALAAELGVNVKTIARAMTEAGITQADRKDSGQQGTDGAQAKAEAVEAYSQIDEGDLSDPLNAAKWLFSMAVLQVKRISMDLNYPGSEAQRRKEIAAHSTTALKLMPTAELHAARKALRDEARSMDEGSGPEVRPVAAKKPKRARRKSTQ